MTSKRSWNSLRLLRGELGRNLWMNALFSIALFFALPVAAVMALQNVKEELANEWLTLKKAGENLTQVLTQNPFVMAFVVGFALLAGLAVFSYLHSRPRTDLYHALPIRRQGLFFAQYGAGALAFLLPYLVMQGLVLLIFAVSGFGGVLDYGMIFTSLGINVLFYLMIYSTAVLAANLCGNLVVSALGALTLCAILPALLALAYYYAGLCFDTLYIQGALMSGLLMKLSPVGFYIESLTKGMESLDLLGAVSVTVLLTLASLFLHRDRASEAAGHAIAFRWAEPVIKYPLVLVFTLLGGLVFGSMGSGGSLGWYLFGFLCGMVLSHIILEVIFHSDARAWKKGLPGLGVFALVFALVAVVMGLDLIGYDRFVPEESQVKSVQMQLDALVNGDGAQIVSSRQYESSWTEGVGSVNWVSYDDPEVIRAALDLAENGAALADLRVEERINEIAAKEIRSFTIRYTLRSGQQVAREYPWVLRDQAQDALKTIFENQQFRKRTYPILGLDSLEGLMLYPEESYSLEDEDEVHQEHVIQERSQVERLVKAYRADYERMTWEQSQEERIVGRLLLCDKDTDVSLWELVNRTWFAEESPREYGWMPVYESFRQTLDTLEELTGFTVTTELNPKEVREIQIEYGCWVGEPGENQYIDWRTVTISDPEEIAQELPRLVLTGGGEKIWYEGQYSVAILNRNDNWVQAQYRDGEQPQWLEDALKREEGD